MNKPTNRSVAPLARAAALFGLLGLGAALLFGELEDFLAIRELSYRTLLLSALLLGLSFVCGGLRLQLLGRTVGDTLRLPSAVRAHILGAFSAAVTPSGSGNALAIAAMKLGAGSAIGSARQREVAAARAFGLSSSISGSGVPARAVSTIRWRSGLCSDSGSST